MEFERIVTYVNTVVIDAGRFFPKQTIEKNTEITFVAVYGTRLVPLWNACSLVRSFAPFLSRFSFRLLMNYRYFRYLYGCC